MSWGYYRFPPYVPVAQRRANAAAAAAKLAKKEKRTLAPIKIEGRAIATSFWGKAWCDNLESYSDFDNRLPRGRSYARNGLVVDLQIRAGKVKALVSGSQVYHVTIGIKTLSTADWARIKKDCTRSIDSLMDLLQGRFDQAIMQRLSQQDGGLFPQPREIDMKCSCPDWAGMCKHVAATLYGVGARLDSAPELLFTLRNVDHLELISQAVDAGNLDQVLPGQADALAGSNLGEIFGIDLDAGSDPQTVPAVSPPKHASKKQPSIKANAKKTVRKSVGVAVSKTRPKKSAPARRKAAAGAR